MPTTPRFDKYFWFVISSAVLCGLAAGVLGAVFTRTYIWQDILPRDVDLSELNMPSPGGLIIRDPKNVTVSADVKITETLDSLRPLLVGIFKAIPNQASNDYYALDQPLFTGLIITADGWVMAPVPLDLRNKLTTQDYVAITSDRRIYPVEQVMSASDLPGDFFFFRLVGAANLPVKKAAPRLELKPGKSLLVVKNRQSVWPTNLTTINAKSDLLSSEDFPLRLDLAGLAASDWENSFVFDWAGNLVAMIDSNKEIVPAFSYLPLMAASTQGRLSVQPFLGLNYLDLSMVRLPSLNYDKGALIYAPAQLPAVVKGSPAELAGLQRGDIITWIGNRELDADHSLADVISTYQAGDKILLSYIRDDKENNIEIILAPWPSTP